MDSLNAGALDAIADVVASTKLPPVHEWQPARTRDIDIRIARNGEWFHEGTLIQRHRMVQLFSTVLRVDDGETYLVTPQERLKIQVEDAPFTAVLLERTSRDGRQVLVFTTNVGDRVIADAEHLITVSYDSPDSQPFPYVRVRCRLRALISRSVFMQLADYIEEREGVLGVVSNSCFMPLSDPVSAID